MAVKKTLKSKIPLNPQKLAEVTEGGEKETVKEKAATVKSVDGMRVKKQCQFCQKRFSPNYFDATTLRRFMSDRGRINPRTRSGNCAKHQRRMALHIKYARHLALLPFKVSI